MTDDTRPPARGESGEIESAEALMHLFKGDDWDIEVARRMAPQYIESILTRIRMRDAQIAAQARSQALLSAADDLIRKSEARRALRGVRIPSFDGLDDAADYLRNLAAQEPGHA